MRKYIYFIILIIMVAIPATNYAQQDKSGGAKQSKNRIVGTPNAKKQNNVNKIRTIDPGDEYSGVIMTEPGTNKKKKSNTKTEPEIDTTSVPDPSEMKNTPQSMQNPYLFDENPQDKENEKYDRDNNLVSPATEEEDYADNNDIVAPSYAMPQLEDPGTDSEEDILRAEDNDRVHVLKMDISNMQPINIKLTDPEHGKYFVFPTPDKALVSSHFGPRHRRFHYGVDLALATGEPIYAAFDGIIRFSKYNSSYGNLIVIRHDNGLETYYAHLSKRLVTAGTRVRAGEEIGLCGNTGHSRGSHLHFEIRYNGNAMNPENIISCESHTLLSQNITLTKESFRKVAKPGYQNNGGRNTGRSSNYSDNGKYYKIRSGDTLSRIAKRNGTTVAKLCKLNGMKETTVLRPGKKIRIR